ncbi:DUF3667 domain-containing protein [Sediminibacterium sp. Gen4]|uniref:DUF3667 domain-containing protein n=1 Tax=Sediminibacterium sp. Gen4 TaxID=2736285 RepID=UPI0015C16ACE|nr:DUF3667 domain-containing protein [Sediminibacterium sp. Gen4]
MHDVFHDAIHYFTHADKGIFTLLISLIKQPGLVAKEYVEGKRKRHFPPLNFFLIVAAVYIVIGGITSKYSKTSFQRNTRENSYTSAPKITSPSNVQQAEGIKRMEKMANMGRFFSKYSNYVAMLAAPLISFLIWLLYLRGRYNYTEHLVANLYLIGFTNLFRCLLVAPIAIFFSIDPNSRNVQLGFVLFEVLYRTLFYYRFMGEYNWAGKAKAFLVSAGTAVFWSALIGAIFYVNIRWG